MLTHTHPTPMRPSLHTPSMLPLMPSNHVRPKLSINLALSAKSLLVNHQLTVIALNHALFSTIPPPFVISTKTFAKSSCDTDDSCRQLLLMSTRLLLLHSEITPLISLLKHRIFSRAILKHRRMPPTKSENTTSTHSWTSINSYTWLDNWCNWLSNRSPTQCCPCSTYG